MKIKPDDVEVYSPKDEKERDYVNGMRKLMEDVKDQRKRPLPIFDGQTYEEYYNSNEALANTNIKKGRLSTGTVETKVHALISEMITKNFLPDVEAYDENDQQDRDTARVMEDAIVDSFKKEIGDGAQDREKVVRRWSELIIQGTVVTQDSWKRYFGVKRDFEKVNKYSQYADTYRDSISREELLYEGPELDIISGLKFFFGNIGERTMLKQPCVFSVITMPYAQAKSLYGDFENFKYVYPGERSTFWKDSENQDTKTLAEKIIESDLEDHEVEVIKFEQNIINGNHFQVMIQGAPMMPIDFPLEGVTEYGMYSYVSQTLGYSKYIYGKSFVSSGSVKKLSQVIDMFLELMVRKTKKSMDPSYINTSNRKINKKILDPGMLTMFPDPDALQRIGEPTQGVSGGEFNVFTELLSLVDQNTVSNLFQGQESSKQMTATQVEETRNRAKKVLALIEYSIVSLEIKIAYRRLAVLNMNWFNPIGNKPVTKDGKRVVGKKYRNTERETEITGRGTGIRKIYYIDGDMPKQAEVDKLTFLEEKVAKRPVEVMVINPTSFATIRRKFFINVYSKPEKGDIYQRAETREMLADAVQFANMGIRMNPEWMKESYANSHDRSVNDMFAEQPEGGNQLGQPGQQTSTPGLPNTEGIPSDNRSV